MFCLSFCINEKWGKVLHCQENKKIKKLLQIGFIFFPFYFLHYFLVKYDPDMFNKFCEIHPKNKKYYIILCYITLYYTTCHLNSLQYSVIILIWCGISMGRSNHDVKRLHACVCLLAILIPLLGS